MSTASPAEKTESRFAWPSVAINSMNSRQVMLSLLQMSQRADEARKSGGSDDREKIIPFDVLEALVTALHHRDPRIAVHGRRVAMICRGVADSLGWGEHDINVLEIAAVLHDLGKIGVPDHILLKPGKLSADEEDLLDLHHRIGLAVLQACRVDHDVLRIFAQMNDHFNGAADDFRNIGSELHQGARILAVADAFDSLSTAQVYRDAKVPQEIFETMRQQAGTKFDGNVVAALERWVNANGLRGLESITAQDTEFSEEDKAQAVAFCNIFGSLHMLESMYGGFHIVDAKRQFIVWNAGLEELLEYRVTDMLGRKWCAREFPHADQFGESALAEEQCPLILATESRKPVTVPVQIKCAQGTWKPVELHSIPLIDDDGELQGVAEIVRNLAKSSKRESVRDLALAASRDALTGVANRGQLEKQLQEMLDEFGERSDPEPFSVMFIDVDFFKSINDTHGHGIGDRVLIDFARLLQNETYSGELVTRYGGEEFVLLCPQNDLEAALRKAERIRQTLRETELGGLKERRVTASFGVTQVEPRDTIDTIFKRADLGVYRAKEAGRDRTVTVTLADIQQEEKKGKQDSKENAFLFEGTFEAFVTTETSTYKLGGFIDDYDAKIIKVKEGYAKFQIGKATTFGGWGKSEQKQPVMMVVKFGEIKVADPNAARGRASRIEVITIIKPLGRPGPASVFQSRARHVFKELKAYFASSTE